MEVTLELVEFANRKPDVGSAGPVTVSALQKTWRVLSRINGTDPACLGLHPAVYFYSHSTGKHQPAALMAVIRWIAELNDQQIEIFTSIRKEFEDFLIENSAILGETISRRGSRGRSVPTLIAYYSHVVSQLLAGKNQTEIYDSMRSVPRLAPFSVKIPNGVEYGPDFSREVKSFALITDALNSAPVCRICGARYHPDSVNLDHAITKREGGIGEPANARPTHYYCNSNRDRLEALIAKRKAVAI